MSTGVLASPLVLKVIDQVRGDIAAGRYVPHQRLSPERVMCKKYGVSRPTLRAALARLAEEGLVLKHQNRGVQVAPGVAQRLQRSVKVKHRMVFIQLFKTYEWLEITKGMHQFADENPSIEPLVIDVDESYERCRDAIEHFASTDAGIFTRVYPSFEAVLNSAIVNGKSVVSWGLRDPLPDYSSVAVDEVMAGYLATDHLLSEHGIPVHHVALDTPLSATYGRSRGWVSAMRDHGFSNHRDYFIRVELSEEEAIADIEKLRQCEYDVMARFFRAGTQEKYCIFTMGDFTATSVYKAAKDAGLAVGKQVYVVGFNNRPLCQRLDPPLSSVAYAAKEIGYQGAKMLYEHMAGQLTRPLHKVLPVKLVVRQSSTGIVAPSGNLREVKRQLQMGDSGSLRRY